MRTKVLLAVFFTASMCSLALVLSGILPSPWNGGGTAEARTAFLSEGVFTPIGGGAAPASPAQVVAPSAISFQARLTNPSNGMPVADGTYSVVFRVFDIETGGTELWSETQSLAVTGGLFNHHLGSINSFPTDLFAASPRFLEVQVGADPAMAPRLEFLSVPYAFRADIADVATVASDLDCGGLNCVAPSEVEFNYAASATQGGPASDVACIDCIAGSEAQFNYAGSATEGGPASDVNCSPATGCINSGEIVDNSVAALDVQFNYAGSTTEGGPASDLACANFNGCVDPTDVQFNYAGSTSEGGPASDINCLSPGCVSGTEIIDGQVASVDITDDTVTSTDITNSTIVSIDISDGTITSADVADNSLTNTDVAINYAASLTEGGAASDLACANINGCVESSDVQFNFAGSTTEGGAASDVACTTAPGCISSAEIIDNTITSGDVAFNYAGSATEGGIANDSQALDTFDSTQFLRSDTSDSFTNGTLTLNSGTFLDLRNGSILLSNNGGVGAGQICFFDETTPCNEQLVWSDLNDEFVFTNDLRTVGTMTVGTLGAATADTLCRSASAPYVLSFCSSSARYKEDIVPLAFDGEKLLALRPVEFKWKDSGEPGVGLVAEEVAKVIPELVTYNDKGEIEGVRYDQLAVYLLEMVKQQQRELSELQAEDSSTPDANASNSFGGTDLVLVIVGAVAAAALMSVGTSLAVARVVHRRGS
jgi:hypothetical protein